MGTKRVGLARTQKLLENLDRSLNLQNSDLTINILSGSTVSASAFVGDGSALTGISGGGGSPGGSDTQVQFNSGSSFGGSSNFVFDYSSGTNQLKVTGSISGSGTATFGAVTTDGAATVGSVASTAAITATTVSGSGAVTGATLNCDGAATVGSVAMKVQASGSISANDIVVAVGYTGTTMKVQPAHAMVLSHARGPFYVADSAASDGATFNVVSSKLVTGIDTSAANSIGDALYLASGSSGSVFFGEVPLATADEAHFALSITVGRVVNVDGSDGAYLLSPPLVNSPLVGTVIHGGAASTQVVGFGSEYKEAQVLAQCNTDPVPSDDDQIKSAFIVESGTYAGNLQITLDHSHTGARLSYAIYI